MQFHTTTLLREEDAKLKVNLEYIISVKPVLTFYFVVTWSFEKLMCATE